MITFVTDAGPLELENLAGVRWRVPTPECRVTFGAFQDRMVGVEPCGKLWAVHSDSEQTETALVSFLAGCVVYGADIWRKVSGVEVPRIAGGDLRELIGKACAVSVGKYGSASTLSETDATALLTAARGAVIDV